MIEDPQAGCVEIVFAQPRVLAAAAQVALEDYARVLANALHSQVRCAPARDTQVLGVHLCAPEAGGSDALRRDVEAFAGDLAEPSEGAQLGWN